jgi:gamma-glutamylcyclotransferase
MIHYFAYGSNMLTQRLQARCSSARPLGVATLSGFSLDFSKRGQDGSGKATLVASTSPTCEVYGVVFELAVRELPTLDLIEGLGKGYDRPDGLSVKFLDGMLRAVESQPTSPTPIIAIRSCGPTIGIMISA